MIKEIYELVRERLVAAMEAPESSCRVCAMEELEEVLAIIEEIAEYNDEELG